MSYDPDGSISTLQAGLAPERPHSFVQADALVRWSASLMIVHDKYYYYIQLVFDLAWTLLAQRRYLESADMFLKMIELNSW